ncbi:uncharacterized protein LOC129593942 [Paramacrobiotus metropolitanus]|uniref:uncharacterized protein LOC129593942 n=1 Tax=Paramacrobiotus metropolitanus TaxID=2943436 RepID=UPI002445C651|nr:uncharacterized protein LOC129593942 [Paramacrobiotus metropolitanus]
MHTTLILMGFKKGKIFPVQFKELLPLKLKNSVSFKGLQVDAPRTCLQPMTEMFECFKKNEFSQTACAAEILAFKECSMLSAKEMELQKVNRKTNQLNPSSERLTTRQANVLLGKFPQHNDPAPDRWP